RLHNREITLKDRLHEKTAHARYPEQGFDDDGADQDVAELEAKKRYNREQCVAQRMDPDHNALRHALGASGPYIVLREDFQHRRARLAHDERATRDANRDRWQQKMRKPTPGIGPER